MSKLSWLPDDRFTVCGFLQVRPAADRVFSYELGKALNRLCGETGGDAWIELPPVFCVGKHDFCFAVSGTDLAELDHQFYSLLERAHGESRLIGDYAKLHLTEIHLGDAFPPEDLPPVAFCLVKLTREAHLPDNLVPAIGAALDSIWSATAKQGKSISARFFLTYGLHELGCLFFARTLSEVSRAIEALSGNPGVLLSNTIPLIRVADSGDTELLVADGPYDAEPNGLSLDVMVGIAPGITVGKFAADLAPSLAGLGQHQFTIDYRFGSYDVGVSASVSSVSDAFSVIETLRHHQGVVATASCPKLGLQSHRLDGAAGKRKRTPSAAAKGGKSQSGRG